MALVAPEKEAIMSRRKLLAVLALPLPVAACEPSGRLPPSQQALPPPRPEGLDADRSRPPR